MSNALFGVNSLIISIGLLLLAINVSHGSHSSIRVEENGYKGVVIAISPEIKDNPSDIISKTEDLIRSASKVLFNATDGHLFFSEVTIVVPSTDNVPAHRYSDADIIIAEKDSSVQSFTMQYAGCGRHALPIVLTRKALQDIGQLEEGARLFVHEWAHYRFGVFNEFGYPSDPLYPPYYSIPGKPNSDPVIVNSCADGHKTFNSTGYLADSTQYCTPVTSNSSGLPEGDYAFRCMPIPDPDNSFQSSLMYSHSVTGVSKFCGSTSDHEVHEHNSIAPNKHNVLCDGRDVMSVIKDNPDWIESQNKAKLSTPSEPPQTQFILWKDTTPPRTLFAVHVSKAMEKNHRISIVNQALNKFALVDTPNSLKAFFTYNRGELLGSSRPLWSTTINTGQISALSEEPIPVNFTRLLIEAQTIFKDGLGGVFVVFIGNEIDKNNTPQQVNVEAAKLRSMNVKVIVILYPVYNNVAISKHSSPLFKTAVDTTGGQVFYITEDVINDGVNAVTTLKTTNQIMKALRSVVNGYSGGGHKDNLAYHLLGETVFTNPQKSVRFDFTVDTTILGLHTERWFRVYFMQSRGDASEPNLNVITPNSVKLTNPKLTDQGMPNFVEYNNRVQGFEITLDSSDLIGNWTLTADISLYAKPSDSLIAIAEFVTTSDDNNVLTAKCWLDTTVEYNPLVKNVEPIIAYVNLNRRIGELVSGATVHLLISYDQGKWNETIKMLDDGLGDPDVTKGDGIYSQYMVGQQKAINMGYYTISAIITTGEDDQVTVTKDFGSTSLPTPGSGKLGSCCGSQVKGTNEPVDTIFTRIVECGSIYVVDNYDNKKHPPNTVRDFRVQSVDYDNRTVSLTWSAPGADYTASAAVNEMSVKSYELKAFLSHNPNDQQLIQAIKTNFDSPSIASIKVTGHSFDSPAPSYGQPESVLVTILSDAEGYYYIALRATDGSGQTSKVSNVVMAYIKSNVKIQSTTAFAIDVSKSPVGAGGGGGDGLGLAGLHWWEILAICIGCAVFLLLVILIAICFICKKRRKSDDSERTSVVPQRKAPEPPARVSPELEKNQTILLDNGSYTHSIEKIPNLPITGLPVNGLPVHNLQANNAYDSGSQRDLRELSINALSPVQSWDAKDLLSHWGRVQEAKSRHEAPPVMRIEDIESTSSGHRSQSYASSEDDNTAIYTDPNNWRYQDVTARPTYIANGYNESIYRNSRDPIPIRANTPSDTVPRYSTINRIPTQNVSQV